VHAYTGKGADIDVAEGLKGYLHTPKQAGKIGIVVVNDIFGYQLTNIREWADLFSEATGATAIVPDFFDGKPWPNTTPMVMTGFMDWIVKFTPDMIAAVYTKAATYLATKCKVEKIVCVGFCWGGRATTDLCASRAGAASGVAPSLGLSFYGGRTPLESVAKLTVPHAWYYGGADGSIPAEQQSAMAAAAAKLAVATEVKTYAGMPHGFAHRGDPNDKATAEAASAAFQSAVAFVKKNLAA